MEIIVTNLKIGYRSRMHIGLNVVGTISLLCAGSGAWLAAAAHRFPVHSARMEYIAGVMLIGGLALLGACLRLLTE